MFKYYETLNHTSFINISKNKIIYHLIPNEREISSVDTSHTDVLCMVATTSLTIVTPSVSAAQFTPLASLPNLARWLRDISSVKSEPLL